MENIVHIHELLQMIFFSNKQYTRTSLIEEVIETFGEDVLFTNCSDGRTNPGETIDFLVSKNKIEFHGDDLVPVGTPCKR